jgi:hypothetical protein
VTFPSGATAAYVGTDESEGGSVEGYVGTTSIAPGGTALADRVFAVRLADVLVVSGPRAGVVAEVRTATGALLSALPLSDGAGAGQLPDPAGRSVRILDLSGALVGSAPVEEAR